MYFWYDPHLFTPLLSSDALSAFSTSSLAAFIAVLGISADSGPLGDGNGDEEETLKYLNKLIATSTTNQRVHSKIPELKIFVGIIFVND